MLALLAVLSACGGGGGGTTPPGGGGTPTPTPTNTPATTPTPAAQATQAPPPGINTTLLPNSWGRFAPVQVFDNFVTTNTFMSQSTIATNGSRYPAVWGSWVPQADYWAQSWPNALTSLYYIPEEDSNLQSGHDITWWLANHPDWILYTCDSTNTPTTRYAYAKGVGFPDVPLDMHNPHVVQYQIQSVMQYMALHHYHAAALDLILFRNVLIGGNPNLGQGPPVTTDYGCGVYANATPLNPTGGGFTVRYQPPNPAVADPAWVGDVLNWVSQLHTAFAPNHYKVFINHPPGTVGDPSELALMQNTDMQFIETGFSDYGNYTLSPTLFTTMTTWVKYLQTNNQSVGIIDRFSDQFTVAPNEVEYALATYMMANEQSTYLFMVPLNLQASNGGDGYGDEQWHPEYNAAIGVPCKEMYQDPLNPQIWYRPFSSSLAIVNSGNPGSTGAATLPTLPSGETYTDIEGRAISNPLNVASHDAYVLLVKGANNGCLAK